MIANGCWNCKNRTKRYCSKGCHKNVIEPFKFGEWLWTDVKMNIEGILTKHDVIVGKGCENLNPIENKFIKEKVEFS